MAAFATLSEEILRLHPMRAECIAAAEGPRQRAAMLALLAYPGKPPESAAINIAALALAMERLVVHRPQVSAIEQIDATDLHHMPPAPPRLMQTAFLIESPDYRNIKLLEDIVAIGGYRLDGKWFLLFWRYPDGCGVFEWAPQWDSSMDAEMGVVMDNHSLLPDAALWGEQARQSTRFALILALLLDAEGSPVDQRVEKPQRPIAPKYGQKRPPANGWETRHLVVPAIKRPASEPGSISDPSETEREGLLLHPVAVRGFLRRQPHGPRSSERKWIYIASHEARRWVSPLPVHIDIKGAK